MKLLNLIVAICLLSGALTAQEDDEDWTLYKPDRTPTDSIIEVVTPDKMVARYDSTDLFNPKAAFDTSKPDGKVRETKDPRIDKILEQLGTPNPPDPVKIDGYRVQLFFDQDRDKVLGEKARFLSRYPEMEAYLDWNAPNHYLRIGDFYTKQQAQYYVGQLIAEFPSATVYKTKIVLPDLD